MTMTPKTRLFLTIFLGVMSAMAPLSTDMYLPALPELSSDFGISASVTQMTLTMTMIGMATGQMIMGPVSDRYGRKGPLLAGMAVFALTALGCATVPDIRAFLVLRFLMGFAGASGIVIARAIARDVAEGVELTRFFAILMMVNGLAPILAPVIGGQVLLFSDWRGIFVLLIAVGLVQSGATMVYRETLPQEKRIARLGASFQKFPQLLHDKYFMGHCLTQCFVFGAFFSYIAGASFLFQNIYHVTPQTFSYIFGGIGAGLLVCGMVPARLAGRVPDVELLMWALIVPVIGSDDSRALHHDRAALHHGRGELLPRPLAPGQERGQRERADWFRPDDPRRPHDAPRRHRRQRHGHPDGHHHAHRLHARPHHVPDPRLPRPSPGRQDYGTDSVKIAIDTTKRATACGVQSSFSYAVILFL